MRLHTKVRCTILLVAGLGQTALTQCPHTSQASGLSAAATPSAQQRELEDHTVLLMLTLSKRGAVRDATVIKGATTLREAAIEAASKHNYKHQMNVWPFQGQITVEIIFPQDNRSSPEIRLVLPAGVPSCIPAPTRIRISQAVMATRLLSRVEPVYPPEAQTEHIAGVVVLRLVIDKNGGVLNTDYVSGPPVLVAAAIEAIKQWKYQPYLLNGVLVEVETSVEISFTQ
jgi:TonB family protein